MSIRAARLVTVSFVVSLLAAACGSNPAQPSGASDGSGSFTASVTAPRAVQPADGAQIKNADQPITLVIQNAVVTSNAHATYTFEVATDPNFSSKVQTPQSVAESGGGQTSVKLDVLPAARDYYWHARAQASGTTGVFGPTYKFTVGPAIVVNPPVPIGPLNGTVSAGWPTFTVANATRVGPAGAIVYRFEVANSASFGTIVVSGTVAETPGQTSFTPPSSAAVPAGTTLYWRATAIDQTNNVTSPASAVQSFTPMNPTPQALIAAQLGVPLWPGAQPPGTNGHAQLGTGWDVRTIVSFNGVTFVSPPIEQLQVFDLIDRGMDPFSAIDWMKANGYATTAAYYPSVAVIGFPFEYMALINGHWDIVVRVGA